LPPGSFHLLYGLKKFIRNDTDIGRWFSRRYQCKSFKVNLIFALISLLIFSILIDKINDAFLDTLKFQPNFDSADSREGMALQNLQARSRMVLAYLHAQTALIHAGSIIF
jgi:NH3-dependent NAD+ synthetase